MKIPPPIRRHVFRDAKCACRTFMGSGAYPARPMKVYHPAVLEKQRQNSILPLRPFDNARHLCYPIVVK